MEQEDIEKVNQALLRKYGERKGIEEPTPSEIGRRSEKQTPYCTICNVGERKGHYIYQCKVCRRKFCLKHFLPWRWLEGGEFREYLSRGVCFQCGPDE